MPAPLPARRVEQQQHQPERHRRDQRPLQGLCPLRPGRLQTASRPDAESRSTLGYLSGPFYEVNNLMSFFNPTLANPAAGGHLGALQFAGSGANTCNCKDPVDTSLRLRTPRGAADRLNDKTVLRAGYSIMYVHVGGVGGTDNSRQDSASSASSPPTLRTARGTTPPLITGTTVCFPSPRRRPS